MSMALQVLMMLSAGFFRIRSALPRPVWMYPISYIAFHTYSIQACWTFYNIPFPLIVKNLIDGGRFPRSAILTFPSDLCHECRKNNLLLDFFCHSSSSSEMFVQKEVFVILLSKLLFSISIAIFDAAASIFMLVMMIDFDVLTFLCFRVCWRTSTLGLRSQLGRSGRSLAIRPSEARMTSLPTAILSGKIYWCCF